MIARVEVSLAHSDLLEELVLTDSVSRHVLDDELLVLLKLPNLLPQVQHGQTVPVL